MITRLMFETVTDWFAPVVTSWTELTARLSYSDFAWPHVSATVQPRIWPVSAAVVGLRTYRLCPLVQVNPATDPRDTEIVPRGVAIASFGTPFGQPAAKL